jgi:hypothetical protein
LLKLREKWEIKEIERRWISGIEKFDGFSGR